MLIKSWPKIGNYFAKMEQGRLEKSNHCTFTVQTAKKRADPSKYWWLSYSVVWDLSHTFLLVQCSWQRKDYDCTKRETHQEISKEEGPRVTQVRSYFAGTTADKACKDNIWYRMTVTNSQEIKKCTLLFSNLLGCNMSASAQRIWYKILFRSDGARKL